MKKYDIWYMIYDIWYMIRDKRWKNMRIYNIIDENRYIKMNKGICKICKILKILKILKIWRWIKGI